MNDPLTAVKNRVWFYEFELPDGTITKTDIPPEVLRIHTSRRDKLRAIIETHVAPDCRTSAIDLASNEGYFSIELARYFHSTLGLELRERSVTAARLIAQVLSVENVAFRQIDLQLTPLDCDIQPADFVLVYGLMYHLESPIHVLRLASRLCRKHILIETQTTMFDISGVIEDGHYQWQRAIEGAFILAPDDANRRGGGSTDIALVPTLSAVLYLLKAFGFTHIEVLEPPANDYEQFRRRSRVVVYGRK